MKSILMIGWMCCATLLGGPGQAREFFVAVGGDDGHDGLSLDAPFATIQRGVDAMAPGDVLTIGPGEYREVVRRADLGDMRQPTIIRAAIPGTVLLRGDVPVNDFKKLPGRRFTHVADFSGNLQSVNEIDTLTPLINAGSIAALEYLPGHFCYDAQAGKLYISTTDFSVAEEHAYTASVMPATALTLQRPRRVVLEGLAATGYYGAEDRPNRDQQGTVWGIWLEDAVDCLVRHCAVYLNEGGLGLRSRDDAGGNIVEHCVAYGNRLYGFAGYVPHGDVFRHCFSYGGVRRPFLFYQGGDQSSGVWEHNIALDGFYHMKGPKSGHIRNCIGLGDLSLYTLPVEDSLIAGNVSYRFDAEARNCIFLREEPDLDWHREFADPDNADFRLQAGSRFRDAGPQGRDRGPYPYANNVFYVGPRGDDDADGLSVAGAWRNPARAVENLQAGDTLYLLPGVHAGDMTVSVQGRADAPVRILGRGPLPVAMDGVFIIENASHLAVERLAFARAVEVTDSRDLTFNNCVFAGERRALAVMGADGIRVTHGMFPFFDEAAICLRESRRVHLAGNLYDNRRAAALRLDDTTRLLYSDYNAYAAAPPAAEGAHDRHSLVRVPRWRGTGAQAGLANPGAFAGHGPLGTAGGYYRPQEHVPRMVVGAPELHAVTATTADVEWRTNIRFQQMRDTIMLRLAWGDTPECGHVSEVAASYLGQFTLRGLQPGRDYYFRITGIVDPDPMGVPPVLPEKVLSFRTAIEDRMERRVFYVAPGGDDGDTGLARERAWASVAHAAARARPGDTVMIAGGVYAEQVWVRSTGLPGAPIRFQGVPGEKALMHGAGRSLATAFFVDGKNHIQLDNLYFEEFSYGGGSKVIMLVNAHDARITRCLYDARGGYSHAFLAAVNSSDVLLRNSVIIGAMSGAVLAYGCPGLRIENNVFLRNLTGGLEIVNRPDQPFVIRNNVISDALPWKQNARFLALGPTAGLDEGNNCYVLRQPDDKRQFIFLYDNTASERAMLGARLEVPAEGLLPEDLELRTVTLDEWRGIHGSDSLAADPMFAAITPLTGEQMDWLKRANQNEVNRVFLPLDVLFNRPVPALDFADLFATDPELLARGIGLQPEAFR